MTVFKNSIVVFGGGQQYISKIKRRETSNDIYFYDLLHHKWIDPKVEVDPKAVLSQKRLSFIKPNINLTKNEPNLGELPQKRMGHGGDLIGSALIVYGGIYGEDNEILNDFAGFDIDAKLWLKVKARYYEGITLTVSKKPLGPLAYHAMTSVLEPGTPYGIKDSRFMWIQNPNEATRKEMLEY
jgi:hypothetical protein